MTYQAGLAQIAALLADPAREAMLAALIRGPALSAGELAQASALSPQAASGHLKRLLEGGVVAVEPEGRMRRYRIAEPRVAETIERLAALAQDLAADRAKRAPPEVRRCRQCYDHLAGSLAVGLARGLDALGYLAPDGPAFRLTPAGQAWFEREGFGPLDAAADGRFRFCLDWTEGEPHLAGPLAARLLRGLVARRMLAPGGAERVLRPTPAGRAWFAALGVREPA